MNNNDEERRTLSLFASYSQDDKTSVSKILSKLSPKQEFSYHLCHGVNTDSKNYQVTDSVIDAMCKAHIYLIFISEHSAQADWLRRNMEVMKEERQKNNENPKIFLIHLDDTLLPDLFPEFARFVDFQQISSDPEIIKQRIIEEFISEEACCHAFY